MATRNISTRLAIEGDDEYRQAISNINTQLKILDSQLKLTTSEYKNNANSLDALNARAKALVAVQSEQENKVKQLNAAYKNAQASVAQYEKKKADLTKQIEDNNRALEKLKSTEGDTTEAQSKLTEETARLKKELESNEARLTAAQKGTNDYEVSINRAKTALNNTNDEIRKNDQYLDEAKKSADGYATSIDNTGKKTKEAGDNISGLGEAVAALGAVAALRKMADAFEACIQASVEFESAMAGVAKTTDLTGTELEDMEEAFKRLSVQIPLTASELAKIAEIAGQLGIEKENIVDFVEVMAALAAATNMTSEAAATMFARFASITGMSQDDFDRLGSVIVALGNNFATTESEIADMALRLAAAGKQAGLTESEILGLAAALSAVGLESQAGGSAFSKVLNQMSIAVETNSDQLVEFARIAGMSATEFAKAYQEDAMGALLAFIQGLGNMEAHGKSANVLLEELGLTEVRLRDALLRAAESSDLFASAIQTSNRAWDDNNALSKEAQLRYETTESKLQRLSNAFDNVKIAVGDKLSPAIGKLIDFFTGIIEGIAELISSSPVLSSLVAGLAVAIGVLTVAVVAFGVVLPMVQKAMVALNATMLANPAFWLVAAIAAVVAAVGFLVLSFDSGIVKAKDLSKASDEAVKSLDDFSEACKQNEQSIEANAIAAEQYVNILEDLGNKTSLTADEQRQYAMAVDEINRLIPDSNLVINEQTGLIDKNISTIRANIAAWKDYAMQQARMEALTEMYKKVAAAEVEAAQNAVGLKKTQEEYAEAARRNEEAQRLINERIEEMGYAAATTGPEYAALRKELEESQRDMDNAEKQAKEYNKALEDNAENLEELNEQTLSYEEALAREAETMREAQLVAEGYTEAEIELIKTYENLLSEMDAIEAAYDSVYQAARESIDKQIGMYDTFDYRVEKSARDMIDIWNQQAENLQRYQDNLAAAADASIGLNEDIIKAWSDGTEESAAAVQAFMDELNRLIEMYGENSDEVNDFVDEFNEAYAGTSHAKDSWAETVALMETDFEEAMNQIQEKMDETLKAMDQYDEASAAAKNTCDGYLEEYNRRMSEFEDMGRKLGEAVNRGYKDALDQHSPSRVARQAAKDTMMSYLAPMEESLKDFQEAGSNIGTAVNEGYVDEVAQTIATSEYVSYNSPVTNTNNAASYENSAYINIYPKSMGDTERASLIDDINRFFGSKATVILNG